jgi:hypothetical protein
VLACPRCGGRMRLIAFISEPTVAKRILDHLRLDSTGPPLASARVSASPTRSTPRPPTTWQTPCTTAETRPPPPRSGESSPSVRRIRLLRGTQGASRSFLEGASPYRTAQVQMTEYSISDPDPQVELPTRP